MNSRLQQHPIAIVGMASIFANSRNLEQYWENITTKLDAIMDVPLSRWNIDDHYSPDKKSPDKTYCRRGGFIPDIDFDPMEFGLPPNILEVTDVAQLMALVVARDVLDDAGIGESSGYDRDKVGIVLGVGGGQQQIVPLSARAHAGSNSHRASPPSSRHDWLCPPTLRTQPTGRSLRCPPLGVPGLR
jgi:acyl transferase domain-containing protein